MIMKKFKHLFSISMFFLVSLSACKKGYLDIKPDQNLLIPVKLDDFQKILDNITIMNNGVGLPSLASDDYLITSANLNTFTTPAERNAYFWADDIYEGLQAPDWNRPYQQVFYANVVLDGLDKITVTTANKAQWNQIKGSALFYRAFAFYQLADEFALPYEAGNAQVLPGIPLKLSSDVNERPKRGTLSEVYARIHRDLNEAVNLLPLKSAWLNQPGKLAVWALLARIQLSLGNYQEALANANNCIKESPTLLDYNSLSRTSIRPIAARNVEVLYNNFMLVYSFTSSTISSISPELVGTYHNNDLRKYIFLRDRGNGIVTFKGNYSGSATVFSGLATDEMYLIRAECYARDGRIAEAMDDLNDLMMKRWDNKVTYPRITASDSGEALSKILTERRKELITRGTRWADLKRLNLDARFRLDIKRELNGKEYILKPNSNKYAFPIPQNEIDRSGIDQNPK